eukprot:CAMPEP_0174325152 /NCGR_PEP_ID=MMETSP0810-20121108/13061_1 /TAXON_ID=73025 ORGANISM="Eutreptiella gymnastica-like, Strain CCMP1594" /NCGR_SAMPLE_ID=MMETSP0810 /ASSEMBLY_ACC=CAM_ASM_000659 /LENGTH=32 /DNA_ID= /DNA_START= /DNA_END= /DNA_ORIENTATION=
MRPQKLKLAAPLSQEPGASDGTAAVHKLTPPQ